MPSSESGELEKFWYSFDHGVVYFVRFDTETNLGHGMIGPDEPEGTDEEESGPLGLSNQQINWLIELWTARRRRGSLIGHCWSVLSFQRLFLFHLLRFSPSSSIVRW